MAIASRERAVARFSVEHMVEDYLKKSMKTFWKSGRMRTSSHALLPLQRTPGRVSSPTSMRDRLFALRMDGFQAGHPPGRMHGHETEYSIAGNQAVPYLSANYALFGFVAVETYQGVTEEFARQLPGFPREPVFRYQASKRARNCAIRLALFHRRRKARLRRSLHEPGTFLRYTAMQPACTATSPCRPAASTSG